MSNRKLWYILAAVLIVSFAVLLYLGDDIYNKQPPIPDKVVTTDGQVLFTGQDIKDGQNVWQSMGGQEVGTVWGHGSYVAPDWTADWLHRESMFILNQYANEQFGKDFDNIPIDQQARLKALLQEEVRKNTYDPETKTLTISPVRAEAIEAVSKHFAGLFMDNPDMANLREDYAIPEDAIKDAGRMKKMNEFFFWTSWASVAERPGDNVSYTNNWPHEELVANRPTAALTLWTGFSVILLLAGIGGLAAYYAKNREEEFNPNEFPDTDPLLGLKPTASMKATLKYFWVVMFLILLQIVMGIITAHYSVEGTGFYGIPLSKILPYSASRTWHIQLALFWIATSWLATGLYIAPVISGHEPKFQRAGVNFLFVALLIIVLGSLAGEWMGIMQKLGLEGNFWFGHQGYEYVDLGRFWQIFLFVGLFIWLFLLIRAIMPALKKCRRK